MSVAVVIDAGSSGSRAHLYTLGVPKLETIREVWSMKQWPGLSACARDMNVSGSAKKNVSHLLDALAAQCQTRHMDCSRAPVYLRATAGLRLLPAHDRDRIMQGAAAAIRQSIFQLTSPPRTVPGSEEALYDWLFVNAAARALDAPALRTFAVLDLGGGSTQIAFEPTSPGASSGGMRRLGSTLGSRNLYAVSRLGLGMNEAHAGVLAKRRGTERHPCELPGDYEGCRSAVSDFVRAVDERVGLGPQARTPPLPPMMQLVGLDNFYFIVLALWSGDATRAPSSAALPPGLADANGRLPPAPTLPEIEAQARRVCALSVEALRLDVGGLERNKKLKAEKLPKACTCAALVVVLARELYGVTDAQRIATVAEIGSFDASWALGAMVYEIAQGMETQHSWMGVLPVTATVVALLVGLLLIGCCAGGVRRVLGRPPVVRRILH